jgi:hypothetical protein
LFGTGIPALHSPPIHATQLAEHFQARIEIFHCSQQLVEPIELIRVSLTATSPRWRHEDDHGIRPLIFRAMIIRAEARMLRRRERRKDLGRFRMRSPLVGVLPPAKRDGATGEQKKSDHL